MEINWQDFIKPELLVLVPVLYAVGMGLKKSEIKDKLIPFILGAGGIVLASLWVLATSDIMGYQSALMAIFVAVTQGILCAALSVFVNQMYKQAQK